MCSRSRRIASWRSRSVRRKTEWFISRGHLARVALAGGAPRTLQENVEGADWITSDELIVSHDSGDEFRLETSTGELLYRTLGWLSDARVSPDHMSVAFCDHTLRGADNGSVAIVSLKGDHAKSTLSADFSSLQGLGLESRWQGNLVHGGGIRLEFVLVRRRPRRQAAV
jgi:hypothetical protein